MLDRYTVLQLIKKAQEPSQTQESSKPQTPASQAQPQAQSQTSTQPQSKQPLDISTQPGTSKAPSAQGGGDKVIEIKKKLYSVVSEQASLTEAVSALWEAIRKLKEMPEYSSLTSALTAVQAVLKSAVTGSTIFGMTPIMGTALDILKDLLDPSFENKKRSVRISPEYTVQNLNLLLQDAAKSTQGIISPAAESGGVLTIGPAAASISHPAMSSGIGIGMKGMGSSRTEIIAPGLGSLAYELVDALRKRKGLSTKDRKSILQKVLEFFKKKKEEGKPTPKEEETPSPKPETTKTKSKPRTKSKSKATKPRMKPRSKQVKYKIQPSKTKAYPRMPKERTPLKIKSKASLTAPRGAQTTHIYKKSVLPNLHKTAIDNPERAAKQLASSVRSVLAKIRDVSKIPLFIQMPEDPSPRPLKELPTQIPISSMAGGIPFTEISFSPASYVKGLLTRIPRPKNLEIRVGDTKRNLLKVQFIWQKPEKSKQPTPTKTYYGPETEFLVPEHARPEYARNPEHLVLPELEREERKKILGGFNKTIRFLLNEYEKSKTSTDPRDLATAIETGKDYLASLSLYAYRKSLNNAVPAIKAKLLQGKGAILRLSPEEKELLYEYDKFNKSLSNLDAMNEEALKSFIEGNKAVLPTLYNIYNKLRMSNNPFRTIEKMSLSKVVKVDQDHVEEIDKRAFPIEQEMGIFEKEEGEEGEETPILPEGLIPVEGPFQEVEVPRVVTLKKRLPWVLKDAKESIKALREQFEEKKDKMDQFTRTSTLINFESLFKIYEELNDINNQLQAGRVKVGDIKDRVKSLEDSLRTAITVIETNLKAVNELME